MTPDQFLAKLKKDGPEPAYLFLGPEAFERDRCRRNRQQTRKPSSHMSMAFHAKMIDRRSPGMSPDRPMLPWPTGVGEPNNSYLISSFS